MSLNIENHKVSLICRDGISIKGYVAVRRGQRFIDFINDSKDQFVVVKDAIIYYLRGAQSFRLASTVMMERKEAILNKADIKVIELVNEEKDI